jgi:cytoskeletal protein CcmA (bactofilin family)
MRQKRKEKPNAQNTKPAKVKLFKNPIKKLDPTIISASSRIEGGIEIEGSLIISGFVKGTIKCNSLEILEDANVDAIVEAENVGVAGNFEGRMTCNGKLTILSTGEVIGEITYSALSIEPGGRLDGNLSRVEAKDMAVLPF